MAQLASGAEMDNTGKTGSCEEAEVVKEKQKDVIVISPTGFNPNNMPSAKVTAAKTRGNSLRVKINKLLGECTEQVALILELTDERVHMKFWATAQNYNVDPFCTIYIMS